MSTRLQRPFEEALNLRENDRVELALRLLGSVSEREQRFRIKVTDGLQLVSATVELDASDDLPEP